MGPGSLAVIGAAIAPIFGVGLFTAFGLMCFPSVRGAVVERFRHRTLNHAEAVDIVAQLAALRGEVYALRAELAKATQSLPPGGATPQLGASSPQDRIVS